MARTRIIEGENEDLTRDDSGLAEDKELSTLEAAFDQLAAESVEIQVFRRQPGTHKLAFLDEFSPGLFKLKSIRDEYGGGVYVAQGKRSDGKIAKKIEFRVDEMFKGRPPAPPVEAAGKPMDAGKFLETIMLMQQNQQNQQMQLITSLLGTVAQMGSGRPAERGEQIKMVDVVSMFAQLKTLVPDNSEKMLNCFRQGIEIAQLTNGQKEEPPFWQEVAKALIPAVAPALLGAAAPAPQLTNQPPTDPQQMLILDLHKIMARLKTMADQDADPQAVADFVLDELENLAAKYPDKVKPADVLEFLEDDHWLEFLADKAPAPLQPVLVAKKDWLEKARRVILEMTKPDPAPGPDATANPKA